MDQVVAALGATRLPLAGAEVRLLARNTATTPQPRLEVKEMKPWGGQGARVRMSCAMHEQCLPFYVEVDWADAPAARGALQAAGVSTPPRDATQRLRSADGALPLLSSSKAAAGLSFVTRDAADQAFPATEANVHAGARATLLMDGGRLHIKVPVICLENGGPGRTIRVTGLDHRQTYRAEVIDSTLLKGTL